MTKSLVYLNAFSLITPEIGIDAGADAECFSGQFPSPQPDWRASPECITARAQKRLSPQTLLALDVADRIFPFTGTDAAWVFASAFGEGETLKIILDALSTASMAIRPLRFQNSVHNAASGQWTIAKRIQTAATSICAGEKTVGHGFLKALLQVRIEDRPVGLVLFDAPMPYPLNTSHRFTSAAGAGFAFSSSRTEHSVAVLDWSVTSAEETAPVTEFSKGVQATGNPVFATLPLFECLKGRTGGTVVFGLNGGQGLQMKVRAL